MDHSRYRPSARLLHWLMALLVLLTIPAGLIMVQPGVGRTVQNVLFIYHKNVGVLLFVMVLVRLWVRWRYPPPPRHAGLPGWQERVAVSTHRLLYALLVFLPVAGYVRVRAGGFPVESLDALGIPPLVPPSDAWADTAKALHHWGGLVMAGLVVLHVAAALHHGVVKRDGILSRMWPPVGASKP